MAARHRRSLTHARCAGLIGDKSHFFAAARGTLLVEDGYEHTCTPDGVEAASAAMVVRGLNLQTATPDGYPESP